MSCRASQVGPVVKRKEKGVILESESSFSGRLIRSSNFKGKKGSRALEEKKRTHIFFVHIPLSLVTENFFFFFLSPELMIIQQTTHLALRHMFSLNCMH